MTGLTDLLARKALVIAHPDDESLWAGGLLLKQGRNWTIICCSIPRKDPIRVWEFQQVCRRLNANFLIYPCIEYLDTQFDHLHNIDLTPYDLVLTHNSVGEYGHPHHKAVHNYVLQAFKGSTYFFGYGLPRDGAAYSIDLTDAEYQRKLELIKMYDHLYDHRNQPLWHHLLQDYALKFDLQREYCYV